MSARRGPIVVGTDGSELAIDAARSGLAVLDPDAEVIVAVVVDDVDLGALNGVSGFAGGVATPEEVDAQRAAIRAEGEEIVARTVAALAPRTTIVSRVLEGPLGPTLVALATEVEASAIVIGTRGRGGVKRALLGSVSDFVVRNSPCPVVVVGTGAVDER